MLQRLNVYLIRENCVCKDLDAGESISPDLIVTSMSDEVLKHAAELPEDLKTVKEEEVRLLVTKHLITTSVNLLLVWAILLSFLMRYCSLPAFNSRAESPSSKLMKMVH